MSEQTSSEYMLLFRGNDCYKNLPPGELQQVITKFKAWFDGVSEQGKLKAGQPLFENRVLVSAKNGRVVADGPFAESKESIAGYFLLTVDTMDQAVAIAKNCPSLQYGMVVEVRPVAGECPLMDRVREFASRQELATA